MSTTWNPPALFKEIEKRLGYRMDAEKSTKKLRPPHLLSNEGKKAFDEVYKKQRDNYLEHSLMETYDMRIMLRAFEIIASFSPAVAERGINLAQLDIKLDREIEAILEQRAEKEAEARAKAESSDKKQGEIKGQKKIDIEDGEFMVKDDGSEAEPASECTTKNYLDLPDNINDAIPIAQKLTPDSIYEKAIDLSKNGDNAAAELILREFFAETYDDTTSEMLSTALMVAIHEDVSIELAGALLKNSKTENAEQVVVPGQVDQVEAQGEHVSLEEAKADNAFLKEPDCAPTGEAKSEAPAPEPAAEKPKKGTAKIVTAKKATGKKKNSDLAGAM